MRCALQRQTKYSLVYQTVTAPDCPSDVPQDAYHRAQVLGKHQNSKEEALLLIENEEEQRLLSEQNIALALDEELNHNKNTDWLQGCEQPIWFAHKPIHLIVVAASPPSAKTLKDFQLGLWNGFECVIPAESERVIWKIIEASKVVFQQCEETLKHTPRVLQCWLRSWTHSFLAYPFELPQREPTRRQYYGYHERFLCYIFRIRALSLKTKDLTSNITGLHLSPAQTAMMDFIQTRAVASVKAADCGDKLPESSADLCENLFQLLIMFQTNLSPDRNDASQRHYSFLQCPQYPSHRTML